MLAVALAILTLTTMLLVLNWAHRLNKHWKRKGLKFLKPVIFLGNNLQILLNKKSIMDIMDELYNKYPNELVLGYYDFVTPKLVVRDHELIQKVLVKDFSHFSDHVLDIYQQKNPLDAHLFMLTGDKWRAMRLQLAPIFTSGKLKTMFHTISDIGKSLLLHLDGRIGNEIDIHEVMGLFSMDVIGSTFFGIDPGVLDNPDSEFRQMGRRLNDTSLLTMIHLWIWIQFPKLANKIGVPHNFKIVKDFYCGIIQRTIEYRKVNNIQRNDFVQTMLQLKQKGKLDLKSWDYNDYHIQNEQALNIPEKLDLTDDLLLAQAHSFLTAGFEAVALSMTYTLVELCKNPDVQDLARKDVMLQLQLNGGLTYEAIKNMKYMEQIIKETQRFYPFTPFLLRTCTKDYTLANGYVIKKGDALYIPTASIHKDSSFYPDPDSFKPERFEEVPQPGTFLPFGEGPRMCIALKYAMLVIKYGLALILMNYEAKLSPSTSLPVKFVNRAFGSVPADKIMFDLDKIVK